MALPIMGPQAMSVADDGVAYDVATGWDLQGSFEAATTATEGTTASCDSEFWWGKAANECPWKARRALPEDDAALELDAAGAGAMLQRSRMLANDTDPLEDLAECEGKASKKLNSGIMFYVESMGVVVNYKKTYVSHCGGGMVFPIITAVITADQGKVTDVYWDEPTPRWAACPTRTRSRARPPPWRTGLGRTVA